MEQEVGRVGKAETGSREPSPTVSAASGFDPARGVDAAIALIRDDDHYEVVSRAVRKLAKDHAMHCRIWKPELDGDFSFELAKAIAAIAQASGKEPSL